MRVLLDSSAYSQLMLGREQVSRIVRDAEEVLLPAVVLGELLYGFRHGSRHERNVRDMRAFLDNPYVSLVPAGACRMSRLPFRRSRAGTLRIGTSARPCDRFLPVLGARHDVVTRRRADLPHVTK